MTRSEFDILYRQLSTGAFRRAYALLGDAEAARDMVQTAFLSLWEKRVTIDNPAAYINASVRYQIASRFRGLSEHERFTRLYPIEIEGDDAEDLWQIDEIHNFVEHELSEAVRRVVKAVFYRRMSYHQAAKELDISVSTVNKHVVTALRMLRKHFTKN